MAWLEKRGNRYRIKFRYDQSNFSKTLKTSNRREAEAAVARLEENLRLLERGRLEMPAGADMATFLLSDGKLTKRPEITKQVTLANLFGQYEAMLPAGAMESNSLATVRFHMKHLLRHLGSDLAVYDMSSVVLQGYVDRRSKESNGRGKPVNPITIKKEITTLSSIWNWAHRSGIVPHAIPKHGLKYPKTTEKPPFQTWQEIEKKVARGGLTKDQEKELWDCLYLSLSELDEVLNFIRENASQPFVYPMAVFAAHTGARRSEMMRCEIDDFDFSSDTVLLREKKRARGKRTTRRVPVSPTLREVIGEWLKRHPGGRFLFCLDLHVPRSNKNRTEHCALTGDETNYHLKATLAESKWNKIRGWHVFRHSFCSNCAAQGVDQRLINEWVGHQTEEMTRRYRHLLPDHQQRAIRSVFGDWE